MTPGKISDLITNYGVLILHYFSHGQMSNTESESGQSSEENVGEEAGQCLILFYENGSEYPSSFKTSYEIVDTEDCFENRMNLSPQEHNNIRRLNFFNNLHEREE